MAYSYANHRGFVLSDEGQRKLLKLRDRLFPLLEQTGAVTLGCAMGLIDIGGAMDSFEMIALVDRLVELGDLRKVGLSERVSSQNEIYVRAR